MKKTKKLKNGILLISDNNSGVHSISISLFFKAGTLYEDAKNYGISHLVEHLYFRQLNDLPQKELYYQMESIGGTLRGRTFRDAVCFDICIVPEFYQKALSIITKILEPFEWSEEQIAKEKAVVKGQILSKVNTHLDYLDQIYFQQEAYSVPIMGELDMIECLTAGQINLWKKKLFHCNNACVVITGAVTEEDLLYTTTTLQQIQNQGLAVTSKIIRPKNQFRRNNVDYRISQMDDNFADVLIAFDAKEDWSSIDELLMISSMFSNGVGSRLSYLLTDVHALTDFVSSRVDLYQGFSRLIIEYSVLNENLLESLQLIFMEIQNFKADMTERDYLASIIFFTNNLVKQLDDPAELGFNYGWYDFILRGNYSIDSKMSLNNSKLSIACLTETAQTVFRKENMIISIRRNRKVIKKHALEKHLQRITKSIYTQ